MQQPKRNWVRVWNDQQQTNHAEWRNVDTALFIDREQALAGISRHDFHARFEAIENGLRKPNDIVFVDQNAVAPWENPNTSTWGHIGR